MLKVLYLAPAYNPFTSLAFRNVGVDLTTFDWINYNSIGRAGFAKIFLDHVEHIKPDLMHMQLQFSDVIDPAVITKARAISPKTIFTNWSGDIRKTVEPYFVSISKVVDYSFLSNRGQIPLYVAAGGKNILYWQDGYDPQWMRPLNKTEFKYKIAFTANAHPDDLFPDAKLRKDIMRVLRRAFGERAGLFGAGHSRDLGIYPVYPSELINIYNDSVCVLSASNFNDVEDYFSDRLLYCVGSGRPTIVYRFPGLEKYFKDGEDVLVANSIGEITDIAKRLNDDLTLACTIGASGNKQAIANHTFETRVSELLSIVGLRTV